MPRFSRCPTLGVLLHRARLAASLGALGVAPSLLAAQTISPPLAEHQERARSSFQLINGTIFPLTAVLDVEGFHVTERGDVEAAPLDTAHVHVKLSATSFRIPPRGTYTVFYEASADSLPAWFRIHAALSGARTDNGLNVRIILPHVVYLNQKQPLRKEEVLVRRLEFDPAAKKARVQLENVGPHLGRVRDLTLSSARNESRPGGGLPLFPHFRRWVELDWDLPDAPVRAQVHFPKFDIDTVLAAATPAGRVPASTWSTDAPAHAEAHAPPAAPSTHP